MDKAQPESPTPELVHLPCALGVQSRPKHAAKALCDQEFSVTVRETGEGDTLQGPPTGLSVISGHVSVADALQ